MRVAATRAGTRTGVRAGGCRGRRGSGVVPVGILELHVVDINATRMEGGGLGVAAGGHIATGVSRAKSTSKAGLGNMHRRCRGVGAESRLCLLLIRMSLLLLLDSIASGRVDDVHMVGLVMVGESVHICEWISATREIPILSS